jgi:hypothetical protein
MAGSSNLAVITVVPQTVTTRRRGNDARPTFAGRDSRGRRRRSRIGRVATRVYKLGPSWSVRRRPLELRVFYCGQLLRMWRTNDGLQFGQVTRALVRALDRCRAATAPRPWAPGRTRRLSRRRAIAWPTLQYDAEARPVSSAVWLMVC